MSSCRRIWSVASTTFQTATFVPNKFAPNTQREAADGGIDAVLVDATSVGTASGTSRQAFAEIVLVDGYHWHVRFCGNLVQDGEQSVLFRLAKCEQRGNVTIDARTQARHEFVPLQ